MVTDRVKKLKEIHLCEFAARRKQAAEDMQCLCADFYAGYTGDDRHITAAFLAHFARYTPVLLRQDELLVGSMWHWLAHPAPAGHRDVFATNMGHHIADFDKVLKQGLPGLLAAAGRDDGTLTERQLANRQDFVTVLNALGQYMTRHAAAARALAAAAAEEGQRQALLQIAADCDWLVSAPPATFAQALQLLLFVYIFLETEACCAAVSLGRADKYLSRFYRADLAAGRLKKEQAAELLQCFCIKVSEGDESTMLTLGGPDADPELTVLFLDAQTAVQMRQPSVSLRVCQATPPAVWEAAVRLTQTGLGMPAYFNDAQVIKGLQGQGIDGPSAADYGIVGCYEAAPQGSYSNTVASAGFLYDPFYEFLQKREEYASFDAFYSGWKAFYESHYQKTLVPRYRAALNEILDGTSPFAACCMQGSLERLLLPEQLGCDYTLFGLNVMGIGILVDSIYTVKKLVFEQKALTLSQLLAAAENDFADGAVLHRIRALQGCYGSNTPESNALAADVSAFIGQTMRRYPIREGVITSPGLFWFTGDIVYREYRSTVNGRCKGQLLSYGVMPCATPHTHPVTSVLGSAAHIATEYFPNGCPLQLTVAKQDTHLVDLLVRTWFELGGWHIAFNVADAAKLRAAQQDPDSYQDLMIKISGYSTAFTGLDSAMQTALIQRTENGM